MAYSIEETDASKTHMVLKDKPLYTFEETDASKTHIIQKYHVKSRKHGLCFPICFPACWNAQYIYHYDIIEKELNTKYFIKES